MSKYDSTFPVAIKTDLQLHSGDKMEGSRAARARRHVGAERRATEAQASKASLLMGSKFQFIAHEKEMGRLEKTEQKPVLFFESSKQPRVAQKTPSPPPPVPHSSPRSSREPAARSILAASFKAAADAACSCYHAACRTKAGRGSTGGRGRRVTACSWESCMLLKAVMATWLSCTPTK